MYVRKHYDTTHSQYIVPETKGSIKTICDKKYFLSTEKVEILKLVESYKSDISHTKIYIQVSQANAFKACCSMGMALVTFKTKAEEMCIAKYNLGRLLIC